MITVTDSVQETAKHTASKVAEPRFRLGLAHPLQTHLIFLPPSQAICTFLFPSSPLGRAVGFPCLCSVLGAQRV